MNMPYVEDYMLSPEFWINKMKNPHKMIMNSEEIKNFNKELTNVGCISDMENISRSIKGEVVKGYIREFKLPQGDLYYEDGSEVNGEFFTYLENNLNIDEIKDMSIIRLGIAVANTPVRSFPTDTGVYTSSVDCEFDRLQETEIQALEAVAILHRSRDKKWYFIQFYNYRGWVKKEYIGIAEKREDVFKYLNSNDFLVVTGERVWTQFNKYDNDVSEKIFTMGTKIPLVASCNIKSVGNQSCLGNYSVHIPIRDRNGYLKFKPALISSNADVSEGYLDYNSGNIIEQAFKLLGDRYDWGNKYGHRDCSSFIMYIYKTFGMLLPRNTDAQEKANGIKHTFNGDMDINERLNIFEKLPVGCAIYMQGHVVMYLGVDRDIHYIIHDFYGYTDEKTNSFQAINEVYVTPVIIKNSSSKSYIECFTSAVDFRIEN